MGGGYVIGICDGCNESKIKVKLYKASNRPPICGEKDVYLCDWCARTLLGNCASHPHRELTNNDLAKLVFFAARRIIEAIKESSHRDSN